MNIQELNDAIALQLGRLYIENQALRMQVAALKLELESKEKEVNDNN